MKDVKDVTRIEPPPQELQELQEGDMLTEIAAVVQQQNIDIVNLQKLINVLNQQPPKELIKKRAFGGRQMEYLPISFLEMTCDQVFLGGWEVKNFNYKIIANEIVGDLVFRYYHPIFNQWLERIGAAGLQIQTRSGTDPFDINNKIPNALSYQIAALKAECFRNAVKSIGKIFGRDLNRDFTALYEPAYFEDDITLKLTADIIEKTKAAVKSSVSNTNFNF